MGVGLTTTAQLQGLRSKLKTFGPVHSLWMSATLDASPIDTVDHPEPPGGFSRLTLTDADRAHPPVERRLLAKKTFERAKTAFTASSEKDFAKALASEIRAAHRPGQLTLVVLNRVARSQEVFRELEKSAKKSGELAELALVHSRFRLNDRKRYEDQLFSETMPDAGRIVVATQAIEAGVDVSASTMFTELAPWPNLVQRFGRCNRGGEFPDARIAWIDVRPKDDKDKLSLPYDVDELDNGRKRLKKLSDVGPASLEAVEAERPATVVHTLRRKDLLDLWDTTADLAGNDLDVSRFIRDSVDTDVQFYWREFVNDQLTKPREFLAPQRQELCSVAIGSAKDFLKKGKEKHTSPALAWNALNDDWQKVDPDEVRPGMILLLKREVGGYDVSIGWTGDPKDLPTLIQTAPEVGEGNEAIGDDPDTKGRKRWVTLIDHLNDVTDAVEALRSELADCDAAVPWQALSTAARWHDVGKAHPAFQNMLMHGRNDVDARLGTFWAKSEGSKKGRSSYLVDGEKRIGFRHELASALAWLQQHPDETDSNLVAFLIAAHHGKVRASIRSLSNEKPPRDEGRKFARGVWDGDELPALVLGDGETVPVMSLDLSLMELGEGASGPSWLARVLALRDEFGPFRLTFLEALLRFADWHGSAEGDNRDDH